jgi:hypothetical protein
MGIWAYGLCFDDFLLVLLVDGILLYRYVIFARLNLFSFILSTWFVFILPILSFCSH